MAGLADAVASALDAWGVGPKIVLVGGSMGGVVAQHFALRHPQRVERLLLVATGGFTPNAAAALEKTRAMSALPWNEATVTPIVDGFFNQRPSTEKAGGVSNDRAIGVAARGDRGCIARMRRTGRSTAWDQSVRRR